MADTSMNAYSASGFGQSSGVADLQSYADTIKTDEASLRAKAEAQYRPTFELEQRSLTNQLSALIQAQTDDSDLLNQQYQQSINTMMDKLRKRGLAVGGMPQTTTAALQKFNNDVMDQRQAIYQTDRDAINAMTDTLNNNYEQNILSRMYDNQQSALASLNNILTQISQLQSSSYQDYVKWLTNEEKKQKASSGGGRRRTVRRRSSSSKKTTTTSSTKSLASGYFGGTTSTGKNYGGGNGGRVSVLDRLTTTI